MKRMPVLFVGHGSPTNIVADNDFTKSLGRLAEELPRPRAILVVSAHWETDGTFTQASPRPKTIHDFGGFPRELYETGYQSVGAPELAVDLEVRKSPMIRSTLDWGLDHGAWAVLIRMYPKGDIPVFQLSLDRGKDFRAHFELARELQFLREQGVLILGSGNIVHNLRAIQWDDQAKPYDWTIEFDAKVATALTSGDLHALIHPTALGGDALFNTAHPSVDHYLPILYAAGAATADDPVRFPHVGFQNASISMRSFLFGEQDFGRSREGHSTFGPERAKIDSSRTEEK